MGSRVPCQCSLIAVVPLLMALTLGAPANVAFAQEVLGGAVYDGVSGLPISGALIEALDTDDRILSRTLTDGDGSFLLRGVEGRSVSHVTVVRIGYETCASPLPPWRADYGSKFQERPSSCLASGS